MKLARFAWTVILLVGTGGCAPGDACLRLSDCATGYVCSLGTCVVAASSSDAEVDVAAMPTVDATSSSQEDVVSVGEDSASVDANMIDAADEGE
jgi:hypothetical protein